jgi:hypothetical protein
VIVIGSGFAFLLGRLVSRFQSPFSWPLSLRGSGRTGRALTATPERGTP